MITITITIIISIISIVNIIINNYNQNHSNNNNNNVRGERRQAKRPGGFLQTVEGDITTPDLYVLCVYIYIYI